MTNPKELLPDEIWAGIWNGTFTTTNVKAVAETFDNPRRYIPADLPPSPAPDAAEALEALKDISELTLPQMEQAILACKTWDTPGLVNEVTRDLMAEAYLLTRQQDKRDKGVMLLISMGFTHKIENGFHVVEGHGFKYSHIGLLNIGRRIADHFMGQQDKGAVPLDNLMSHPNDPLKRFEWIGSNQQGHQVWEGRLTRLEMDAIRDKDALIEKLNKALLWIRDTALSIKGARAMAEEALSEAGEGEK